MSTTIQTRTDEIDIACTWGDGPDISINILRDGVLFPVDLNAKTAREMAAALLSAADQSDEMDALVEREDY